MRRQINAAAVLRGIPRLVSPQMPYVIEYTKTRHTSTAVLLNTISNFCFHGLHTSSSAEAAAAAAAANIRSKFAGRHDGITTMFTIGSGEIYKRPTFRRLGFPRLW